MQNIFLKKAINLTAVILFISLNTLPSITTPEEELPEKSHSRILYVGGPGNYSSIQSAIDDAEEGDTVYVYSGTYYENVVVDKAILITGEDKENTTIDGMYYDVIMKIIADDVRVKNFTIRNSGGHVNNAGVEIKSENNTLVDLVLYRTNIGVYVNRTGYNTIKNCVFHTNGEGIFLLSSKNDKISSCCFFHNAFGIHTLDSNGTKIIDCSMQTNGIGIFLHNSSNIDVVKCAVYNNNDNQGGLCIWSSRNISCRNVNFHHNGWGVRIVQSSFVTVKNSCFSRNTHIGILICKNSYDVEIENSEFVGNLRFGISVFNSYCTIRNCNIYDSLFGLFCTNGRCNARFNWWGSPLGPCLFERKTRDRFFTIKGWTHFFPWLLQKAEGVGTDWRIDGDMPRVETYPSRIPLPGFDSDGDLAPDWWEEKWGYDPYVWDNHRSLDPEKDGLNNLEECFTDKWGSNPFKKDIFLELDWMTTKDPANTSNKPPTGLIGKIVESFRKHNITLHVDDGDLGGGEEIPYLSHFSYAELRHFYWKYFLHNNLNNPRKGIFRYGLICNYGPGRGFSFIGWDHLDSFMLSAEAIHLTFPDVPRGQLITGGILHEVGHTLGLTVDDHIGIDNYVSVVPFTLQWIKYRNYKSSMNYQYTYEIIDFSDGTHGLGDFDDWGNIDLSFFKNTDFRPP